MTKANSQNPWGLTHRQCEIMCSLVEHGSNAAIAEELGIHITTVNTAMVEIMGRLSVCNRVQAAILWDREVRKTTFKGKRSPDADAGKRRGPAAQALGASSVWAYAQAQSSERSTECPTS